MSQDEIQGKADFYAYLLQTELMNISAFMVSHHISLTRLYIYNV